MTIPNEGRPAPGSVIGYRRNGAPIRLIAGGSQMAPEAPAPPAEQAPAAPAAPAPPAAPAAPRVPPGQPEGGQFAQPPQPPAQPPAAPDRPAQPETDWKAEAERLKAAHEATQAEAERWKRQARNQEQRSKANHTQVTAQEAILRQIAEKVGIEYDDRPDPDQLLRQLEQERITSRQRTIELGVFTMAASTGANAAAILDSREFMQQAEQLDPSAADFADQVRDLVKAAAGQPRYQFQQPPAPPQPAAEPAVQPAQPQQQAPPQPPAQPPAPASGSDFSGAPGGNRLWTQADYDHWTAPGMDRDGKIMTKAIADGLLVNLGVGKPKSRGRR